MTNNLCNLSNEKLNTLLSLITWVLWESCEGRGNRDLNKWNQVNMSLT